NIYAYHVNIFDYFFGGVNKKPAQWRVLLCSCLLFASRYSFAKHTGIEAICGQKCNSFFH
ncbi:hypothetical protein, partial [Salmonella enterica]|uniref:hypothetical protein n=1 Tax=Salmonella enterica TaxID=28901 RepID=UPI001C0EAA45